MTRRISHSEEGANIVKKAKKIIEGLSEQEVKALLNEAIKAMAKTLECGTTCPKFEECCERGEGLKSCKRLILDELAEKAGVIL